MVRKMSVILFVAAVLSACSAEVKSSGGESPALPNNESAKPDINLLDFSGGNASFENHVPMAVTSGEAMIEFYIFSGKSADIEIVSADLEIVGCAPDQVIHNMYWLPNSDVAEGTVVHAGESLKTLDNIKGKLIHTFMGLKGCKSVALATELRRKSSLETGL